MKTNQLMTRKIGDYEVFQRTKDGMFNATSVEQRDGRKEGGQEILRE